MLKTRSSQESDWSCDDLHDITGLEWLHEIGVRFDGSNTVRLGRASRVVVRQLRVWADRADDGMIESVKDALQMVFQEPDDVAGLLVVPHKATKSLMQILLGEKRLQNMIVELICQTVTMMAFEQPTEKIQALASRLIMSFTFLPVIVDSEFFVKAVFDVIWNTHDVLKPMIMRSLNGIFGTCTPAVVSKLTETMVELPALTQDALMALEGFDLTSGEKTVVRARVLKDVLSASSTRDLPTVMRFLMSSTDDENAASTIEAFRRSLVVADCQADGLSLEDTHVFMMIQIKSGLQFNPYFCNGYVRFLETCSELVTLDIWVLFALFSIPAKRSKAEEMIKNLAGGQLNADNARTAVIGHEKALECLISITPDLVFWCLGNAEEKLVAVGASWVVAFFEEISISTTLQDLVASLCTQVSIGSENGRANAAAVLSRLAMEQTRKLAVFCPLLQGVLLSYEALSREIFKSLMTTIVRITFLEPDDVDKESNIGVFMMKMIVSTKIEAQCAGVITAAAVLNRIVEFHNNGGLAFDVVQRQFESVMLAIDDKTSALNLFFEQILDNKERGDTFNEFLMMRQLTQLNFLLGDTIEPVTAWYGLGENHRCVDFARAMSVDGPRHTLSIHQHRALSSAKSSGVAFTQNGLRILLDAIQALDGSLEEMFGEFFRMPIAMFDRSNLLATPRTVRIQKVIMAHSWIVETLNYFAATSSEECWQRMQHRVELEDLLIEYLSEAKTFVHALHGEMFPKYPLTLKRAHATADPRFVFVSRYRGALTPPRAALMRLLVNVSVPIRDVGLQRCVLSLLGDYEYMIKSADSIMLKDDLMDGALVDTAHFLASSLLPTMITSMDDMAVMITGKIVDILCAQLCLPRYKDKSVYTNLLVAISDTRARNDCFALYSDMVSDELARPVRLSMISLLCGILHNGPSRRIDHLGPEVTKLCELCRETLQSADIELTNADVKRVLPVFFSHNPKCLDDIEILASDVFCPEIFSGAKNQSWPSVNSNTFGLFFKYCFVHLKDKIADISKRFKTGNMPVLDEQSVMTMLERLNRVSKLTKTLLMQISSFSVPSSIRKLVLNCVPAWMDACTGLLTFLRDAREVDAEAVDEFFANVRVVRRVIQSIVDHARRNEQDLQKNVPKVTKSLSMWTYSVKNVFTGIYTDDGGVRIGTMAERTIEGDQIATQR